VLPVHGDVSGDRGALRLSASGPAHEMAAVAAMVQTLTPHFTPGDGFLECPLSWPAVTQCAFQFGDWWRPSPELAAWVQAEGLKRMMPPATVYTPAAGLVPYAHQYAGAQLIKATGRVLLTDEPGTGKTITALLGLTELWANWAQLGDASPEPILVVCPASVMDAWIDAVRLWTPHWSVTRYHGPKRQNKLGSFDVYVTSYDIVRQDAPTGRRGPLNRLSPKAVVIDECHYIKNPGAERSKAVVRVARDAPYVVGMSGTPITHHTGDLTPMLEAMDAGAWPSGDRFKTRYLLTVDSGYTQKVVGLAPHTEPEFRACLEGQLRRVAKADVLDLPPKVYSTRTVEMPNTWRKVYDQFEQDMLAQLPDNTELAVMDVFSVLAHLKSLACAPADVRYETRLEMDSNPMSPTYGEEIEKTSVHLDLKHPSWKVNALLEVLEERPEQSVLVFAPSRQLIMLAGESAERAGRRVGYIVGGQSRSQRTAVVDAFQAGELDTVLATTGAGGVGITLTAASTVVFLQRPLSLPESLQAEDRAHRIGQTAESVEYIDIITKNTIDTRIRDILRGHAGQLAELVRDPRIVAELMGGRRIARGESAA
jgi:SNF2 family DNA or RNA helicase